MWSGVKIAHYQPHVCADVARCFYINVCSLLFKSQWAMGPRLSAAVFDISVRVPKKHRSSAWALHRPVQDYTRNIRKLSILFDDCLRSLSRACKLYACLLWSSFLSKDFAQSNRNSPASVRLENQNVTFDVCVRKPRKSSPLSLS